MTREVLAEKMKDLPNPPCRVNLIQQVWEIMNSETKELEEENAKLQAKVNDWQSEYIELENFKNNEIAELRGQIEKIKKYIKACWVEENLNDYSSYITNTSDEFRDLVKELNEEIRNGR